MGAQLAFSSGSSQKVQIPPPRFPSHYLKYVGGDDSETSVLQVLQTSVCCRLCTLAGCLKARSLALHQCESPTDSAVRSLPLPIRFLKVPMATLLELKGGQPGPEQFPIHLPLGGHLLSSTHPLPKEYLKLLVISRGPAILCGSFQALLVVFSWL